MIKKCKVLLRNDAVMVADYDGIPVQLPSTRDKVDFVDMDCVDGKYFIVKQIEESHKPEAATSNESRPPKKRKKKTTVG